MATYRVDFQINTNTGLIENQDFFNIFQYFFQFWILYILKSTFVSIFNFKFFQFNNLSISLITSVLTQYIEISIILLSIFPSLVCSVSESIWRHFHCMCVFVVFQKASGDIFIVYVCNVPETIWRHLQFICV